MNKGGTAAPELPAETLDVKDTAEARPEERRVAWRIALQQEGMRGVIALILLLLLAVAMVGSITTAGNWSEMKEWLEVWLPALTALLGSASGFYFASRK